MIDKIIELFDKGYCNECNELNCLGGEPSSKTVANAIRELQKENQQLKEQLLELTRNNYKLKDGLNKKAKEYQETYKDVRIEIRDYKNQLKQRDEVIDETIGMLDKLDTDIMQNTIIGFQQFLPRFYEIKEILQRYRGDNNG